MMMGYGTRCWGCIAIEVGVTDVLYSDSSITSTCTWIWMDCLKRSLALEIFISYVVLREDFSLGLISCWKTSDGSHTE